MKLKEVVSMLTEFAKVAGEDCEVQITNMNLRGQMVPDYNQKYVGYGSNRNLIPGYYIVVTDYARVPQIVEPTDCEMQP